MSAVADTFGLPLRHRTAAWVVVPFLAVNFLVRAGLLLSDGDPANLAPLRLLGIFGIGLLFDLAVAAYLIVPFALLAAVLPGGRVGRRLHGALGFGLVVASLAGVLFTAAAEFVFWGEFSSRFNFIAVDYLVYTREVVGNIRESYPTGLILGGIAAVVLAFALLARRSLWQATGGHAGSLRRRFGLLAIAFLLPIASYLGVDEGLKDGLGTRGSRELAGDGIYEFMRAFRSNDLDYATFYRTLPAAKAEAIVRDELSKARTQASFVEGDHPLARQVLGAGPEKRLNVVLVSIESLGSDYVESFGGKPGLTPNLDRLATASLMFTGMHATGLRTVRGLEALTLSLPPTPGHAVPMRANNKGFQTLGGVFRDKGYESLYLYGGYSRFDNMKDFFGDNGYTVIDRTAIAGSSISHETIWGVADEDLFELALREIDARAAQGRRVFAHVMTTSNHRPFTYPGGRIDIPSGSGRDGAVKYTDYALGRFIERAKSRPWFDDTVFVLIADHTSNGRGRTDLPPENFRIPLLIYAPAHIAPAVIDSVASQIDVAPTVLALLNFDYESRFFGQDILDEGRYHQRAFMANYLTVGYLKNGLIVELQPKKRAQVRDAASGIPVPLGDGLAEHYIDEAIAYYQVASSRRHSPRPPAARPRRVRWVGFALWLLSFAVLTWVARDGRLDFAIAELAWDPVGRGFALKEHWLVAAIGHDALRRVPQAGWLVVTVLALLAGGRGGVLRPGWRSALQRWRGPLWHASLGILLAAAVVSGLKRVSAHSCPWDLAAFGGVAEWFPLFGALPVQPGPGHCWPGGHASGGFALIAGYFALRDRAPRAARGWLAVALLLGAVMASAQMLRGAHFLSHNLWSLWLVWASCAAFDLARRGSAERRRRRHASAGDPLVRIDAETGPYARHL